MILFGKAGAVFVGAQRSVVFLIALFSPTYALTYTPKLRPRLHVNNQFPDGLGDQEEDFPNDCGLITPSKKLWDKGLNNTFAPWFQIHVGRFMNLPAHEKRQHSDSIAIFFRNEFANNVPTGNLYCDGFHQCHAPSCKDLDQDLSLHDKQMAWLAFDQFARIDHIHSLFRELLQDEMFYVHATLRSLVETFTLADEHESAAKRKQRKQEIIKAIISAIILVVCAVASGVGASLTVAGEAALASSQVSNAAVQALTSLYLSVLAMAPTWAKDVHRTDTVVHTFEKIFAKLEKAMQKAARDNMQALFSGSQTSQNETLIGMMQSGLYMETDPWTAEKMADGVTRNVGARIINGLKSEHPYILDTDAEGGDCWSDERGPFENRICLEERPDVSYWIFAISADGNKWTSSPPGFHNLQTPTEDLANMTLEDVVLASLFVEDYDLPGALDDISPHKVMEIAQRMSSKKQPVETRATTRRPPLSYYGAAPGGFDIPICYDPKGHAISSVYTKKSTNYPCICQARDSTSSSMSATSDFFAKSKLYELNKFGDVCRHELGCKKAGLWSERLPISKKEKKKIAKKMKKAWTECRKWKPHDNLGFQVDSHRYDQLPEDEIEEKETDDHTYDFKEGVDDQ
ncbi:hypothetical protein K491DRAFT_722372 [Lophiostoma macrostomum CBS 122681]|uniref:Uncharacterized protein n=1 Tax=Lophiostoma macrostomum CBS 122681 TaxID=1314788 RepID=A0A6A6SLE6_9PLEO|nr:hypothetical protein K491DRAFT_722372 [Lophiostoma macrostomum CBS 122681]